MEVLRALLAKLEGEEHRELLAALESLVLAPPRGRVRPRRRARKEAAKADRRLAAARAAGVEELHRARKAAKRARYAAKATGADGARYRAIWRVLGDHRDAVAAVRHLEECGIDPAETASARSALAARAEAALDRLPETAGG